MPSNAMTTIFTPAARPHPVAPAWAAAAAAAIERMRMTTIKDNGLGAASILTAALMLPGVQAHAEAPPTSGTISVGYLDYRDSQSGLDRIRVKAQSISVMAPVAGVWSVSGSL